MRLRSNWGTCLQGGERRDEVSWGARGAKVRAYLAWGWGVSREFLREAVPVVHLQVGVGQQEILHRYCGERGGVRPGGPGGGSRQSRGGHSMPGGDAQVSPRTEQISRELNPPGGQSAKTGFQVAVLKVWPRNPGGPIPENPGDQTIFMIILRTHVPSSVPFFHKCTVEFLSDSWLVRSRQNGCKSRDESPAVVS